MAIRELTLYKNIDTNEKKVVEIEIDVLTYQDSVCGVVKGIVEDVDYSFTHITFLNRVYTREEVESATPVYLTQTKSEKIDEVEGIKYETIEWDTMDDRGYLSHSLSHYLNPNDSSKTLCGVDVTRDDAEYSGGNHCECKRCRKLAGYRF